jgi:hypothetical protein
MGEVSTDRRQIPQIDRPDRSWTPIRFAPFKYQAAPIRRNGPSFPYGPARLLETVIDAVVLESVKDPSIVACKIDREALQFLLTSSQFTDGDGKPYYEYVDPFDARQQYTASDAILDPSSENLVIQIEAVWAVMEARLRCAHQYGHCGVVARAG